MSLLSSINLYFCFALQCSALHSSEQKQKFSVIFIYFCSLHRRRIFVSKKILCCRQLIPRARNSCWILLFMLSSINLSFCFALQCSALHSLEQKQKFSVIFNYFCSLHRRRIFVLYTTLIAVKTPPERPRIFSPPRAQNPPFSIKNSLFSLKRLRN